MLKRSTGDKSNTVSINTCGDTSGRGTRTSRSTTYGQCRSESIHRTSFHRTSIRPTTVHRTTIIDVAADNNTTDGLTIVDGRTFRSNISVSSNEAPSEANLTAGVEANESWRAWNLGCRRFALVAKTVTTRGTVPANVLDSKYSRRERAGAYSLRTG